MSGCCYSSKQVSPAPWDSINNHLVEIRPKRLLHIKHINPRPRDEQFAKELQTFLQYRKKGVGSEGPMMIPKKPLKVSLDQNPIHSNSSSNTQPGVPLINKNFLDLKTRDQTPDSIYSTTEDRKTLISSSGIDVSVHSPIELADHNKPNKLSTTVNPSSSQRQDNNSVLFFIHGVGGSSDIWKSQIDYFRKLGYEIVAPDLIGHGLSCAPKDLKSYHFDQIAADLEEIFDKYCKRNNVVIGHSYGCSFAAFLARNRTRRVTKLVMISGGGPIPLAPQTNVFSLPVSILSCLRPCVQCKYERSAFSQSKKPDKLSYEAFSIPTYVLSNIMKGQIWSDGDEFYHNWIVSPTLLIYGQQDKLITLREEERMREAIYNCELQVLPEAGHMVMLEEPETVNKLLHEFLLQDFRLEGNLTEIKNEIQERSKSRSSIRSTKSVKSIPDL